MLVWSGFSPPHPGFKFLACSYSDRECREGERVSLACSFVSKGVEIDRLLSALGIFPRTFNGGFETFLFFPPFFFFSVDFCCCYALVCLLQCCAFAVEFCDFDVSVNLADPNLCFYFVFSFHYQKESFLKPSDVLM